MKCIDEKAATAELFGSYNSESASNFMVVFERCDRTKRVCKSDGEIKQWLQSKYLVIAQNEKRFNEDLFEDRRIQLLSRVTWSAVSPDIRSDYVKQVTFADLSLNDSPFGIGDSAVEYEKIFKVSDSPMRVMPYSNNFQTAVTFEISSSTLIYTRHVYSSLDWLRDIGGLYGALNGICIVLVALF